MRIAFSLMVVLALASGTGAATRTVEMTAYDDATHVSTILVGAGDGTKSDVKYLFAAYDNADRGTDPSAWANLTYVRTVYASTTNETFAWITPAGWHGESGAMRFFLLAPNGPRVQEGAYIYSDGISVQTNIVGGSHIEYLDTGIVPNSNTVITLETAIRYNHNYAPFGVSGMFYFFSSGSDTPCDFFGNFLRPGKWNPDGDDGVHVISLGAGGAFLDGVRQTGPYTSFSGSTSLTVWLFGRNNSSSYPAIVTDATTPAQASTIVSQNKLGLIKIYSAQIVTNGVLARSFAPRVVDGTPVMWDAVTETAFSNAAPGSVETLKLGETHVTIADGTAETCSAARVFTREITGIRADSRAGTVTLTLGGDNRGGALYAVRGGVDLGAFGEPANWDELILVGKVPVGASMYTATLPAAWWRAGGYARFILKGTVTYDWLLESLSSTGKGLDSTNNGPNDQGYQYIDTGIVPNKNTTTTVSIMIPNGKDMAPVGIQGYYFTFYNNSKYYWNFFGNSSSLTTDQDPTVPTSDGGKRHVLSIGPSGAIADGKTFATFSTLSGSTTLTMPLFARRADSTTFAKFGPCTMYYATIEKGGEIVRDFVPAAKNGVGYMFDRVTKQLFGNANTTYGTAGTESGPAPFVLGEPVVSLSAADVLTISDRLSLTRGTQVIFR